jgi:hypothetical protein
MSDMPWFKFTPTAWRGDQALRAVSIAARGLWIECLCIMHEAKPYGHLLLNGEPVEDNTLARMTGVPVDEVSDLLSELRQAGVLSVTGKGVIFSRRMTRDHARSQKGKKAVNLRWSQPTETKAKKRRPNRYPNRDPTTKNKEVRITPPTPPGGRDGDILKNGLWDHYPTGIHDVVSEAQAAFDLLPEQEQLEAIAGAEAYGRQVKSETTERRRTGSSPLRVRRLARWLREKGWVGTASVEHRELTEKIDRYHEPEIFQLCEALHGEKVPVSMSNWSFAKSIVERARAELAA